jgi:hypothetical protein
MSYILQYQIRNPGKPKLEAYNYAKQELDLDTCGY